MVSGEYGLKNHASLHIFDQMGINCILVSLNNIRVLGDSENTVLKND